MVAMNARQLGLVLFAVVCCFVFVAQPAYGALSKLDIKVAELVKTAYKNDGIVELNSKKFDEYVALPRNYSFFVLLNAVKTNKNCKLCKQVDPEFRLIAKSWLKNDQSFNRIFFGHLEYADGKEIYDKFGLTTAPTLWYYPPSNGPFAERVFEPDRYQFKKRGENAEDMIAYIQQQLKISFPLRRPPDYSNLAFNAFVGMGVAAIGKLLWPRLVVLLRNPRLWSTLALVIILLMTSGQMHNQIRGSPYVKKTDKKVQYVDSRHNRQYGLESQIVAGMYAACSFAVIHLIHHSPRISNPQKQRLRIYFWVIILFGVFSGIFAIFRLKRRKYPYRLLI